MFPRRRRRGVPWFRSGYFFFFGVRLACVQGGATAASHFVMDWVATYDRLDPSAFGLVICMTFAFSTKCGWT